jgi:hypothetical protein
MLYPSHFENDFDGYAIRRITPTISSQRREQKVMERLANKSGSLSVLACRPFTGSGHVLSPQYIMKQIEASRDSGASGYLFWNASNDYNRVFAAMEKIYGNNETEKNPR